MTRLGQLPPVVLLTVAGATAVPSAPAETAPVGSAAVGSAPTAAAPAVAAPESNTCPTASLPIGVGTAQWNGWGRDLGNTRYQPEPALRATDVSRLSLKWAFGYQASAPAGQPTVVDGRVFVASSAGRVYSLDAKTGCTYWTFDAPVGTHTALSINELAPSRHALAPVVRETPGRKHKGKGKAAHHPRALTLAHLDIIKAPSAAFFGDDRGAVYALDAQKGTLLWKQQVDSHPLARIVGTPILYHDQLYVVVASSEETAAESATYACCTFRGSVVALDMTSGRILWKTYAIAEEPKPLSKNATGAQEFGPAGAAILGTPSIDVKRGLLYVATGRVMTLHDKPQADAVLALGLNDGHVRWSRSLAPKDAPSSSGFSASTILRTFPDGRQILLAGQRSGAVYALDPERAGEIEWQSKPVEGPLGQGVHWGMAADYRNAYVALGGPSNDPTDTSGSLAALDMKTGQRRWRTQSPTPACTWGAENCSHGLSQAVTVIPGIAFSGSLDGHLRAYSTVGGRVLWDVETAKDFATVNGVKASGGSLDQGGATIVNGVVYVNSGYGERPGQPGNVLLAFSVDGK